MVVLEQREAGILDAVERGERLLLISLPRVGPGGEQVGGHVVRLTARALPELATGRDVVLGLELLDAQHEVAEVVQRIVRHQPPGEFGSVRDVAVVKRGHEGPLDQFGVVGVGAKRLAKEGRGRDRPTPGPAAPGPPAAPATSAAR